MLDIKDTIDCYEECPRKEQFVEMARNAISIEEVEKLYKFLQGEVPENITVKRPPRLSGRQAFTVVWFLQEVMHLLPDRYERCKTCGDLYDSEQGGSLTDLHCDYCRRD